MKFKNIPGCGGADPRGLRYFVLAIPETASRIDSPERTGLNLSRSDDPIEGRPIVSREIFHRGDARKRLRNAV